MAAAPVPSRRSRRLVGLAAAGAGVAAATCLVGAVIVGSSPTVTGPDELVPPASLAVSPSTIPPRTGPASPPAPVRLADRAPAAPASTPPVVAPVPVPAPARAPAPAEDRPAAAPPTTPATTATTAPRLSPLSSLIGEAVSALPSPPLADVAPTAISIEAIGVRVPVRDVGLAPDGQLEVPDETEVGWYRLGAAPGQPGATVLAAHVSWRDRVGPFLRLAELEPGAVVDLELADGTARRYEVVSRAQYGKLMLPSEEIWRTTGPETLVLITCGGAFNPDLRRYADNIVVTAVPVA